MRGGIENLKKKKPKKTCAHPKQKGAQEHANKILLANIEQQDVQVIIQYQK